MTKNPYYYIGTNPTVDLIVLNHKGEILLGQRISTSEACPGMWALPGGFINTDAKPHTTWLEGSETPETAAKRELKEETCLDLADTTVLPVGVYEGNGRDPRDNDISWSKSHAFFRELDEKTFEDNKDIIRGMDDLPNVKWISIEDVLKMELAFDHKKIIIEALQKYKPELLAGLQSKNDNQADNTDFSLLQTFKLKKFPPDTVIAEPTDPITTNKIKP
jgi:ADP-ribose pyrophosphatase YjhB (NUDIX family)